LNGLALGAAVVVWVGAGLALSAWPRLSRPSLAERLRPFSPGGHLPMGTRARSRGGPVRESMLPRLERAGDRLSELLGISDTLENRLARIHSPMDPAQFRVREATCCLVAFVAGITIPVLVSVPVPVVALFALGGPLLAFLVLEQSLVRESERWRTAVAYELPVVSEQLAMLMNAGFSLGSSLARLAERGNGVVAADLNLVVNRVRHGLSESDALAEWSARAGVEGVSRLVAVLTIHSQAADVGRLVSAEARSARRDLNRRTVEAIESRAQQVWIPVTVATLVPGVILLAVPFLSALNQFSRA